MKEDKEVEWKNDKSQILFIREAIHKQKVVDKINKGKYVTSLKGIGNKIKYYFLGYLFIEDVS